MKLLEEKYEKDRIYRRNELIFENRFRIYNEAWDRLHLIKGSQLQDSDEDFRLIMNSMNEWYSTSFRYMSDRLRRNWQIIWLRSRRVTFHTAAERTNLDDEVEHAINEAIDEVKDLPS